MTTYKESGVDIDAANNLVNYIKEVSDKTPHDHVIDGVGGFASLYELPAGYTNPVLVSGTDGVGTKVKMALERPTVSLVDLGEDVVANVVNDLICTGCKPLYFLDYYASGKLHPRDAEDVIEGIGEGCLKAGISLIGGETSEMPGMYHDHDFDLAGFSVGIVEKSKIINGVKNSTAGDVIIGIASSGPHSNGYSLIRKILKHRIDYTEDFIKQVMKPTTIYVKSIRALLDEVPVNAIANITGGGLYDNLTRIVGDDLCCNIDSNQWEIPDLFKYISDKGNVSSEEMFRVFNMGIGMALIVNLQYADTIQSILKKFHLESYIIGEVNYRNDKKVIIHNQGKLL